MLLQFVAGNLIKVKDQIKKWAVAALEDDIGSFFGTNAPNIVLAMKEDIMELTSSKVSSIKTFLPNIFNIFLEHHPNTNTECIGAASGN